MNEPTIQKTALVYCLLQLIRPTCSICDKKPPSAIHELKEKLLCNYDSSIRPVTDSSHQMKFDLILGLDQFNLNEKTRVLTANSWIIMHWNDSFLKWDPSQYQNITRISLSSLDLWVPDITASYNFHAGYTQVHDQSNPVHVVNTGQAFTGGKLPVAAYCEMDVTKWPFDLQVCTAYFASSLFYGSELDYDFKYIRTRLTRENKVWDLVSSTAQKKDFLYFNSTEFYPCVIYKLKVRRHLSSLISTIIVPIGILITSFLASFWVPPSNARTTFVLIIAAGHVMFLKYLGERLPPNANNDVNIIVFVKNSLLLVFLSVAVASSSILLTKIRSGSWVANMAYWIQNSHLKRFINISKKKSIVDDIDEWKNLPKFRDELFVVQAAMDKFSFIIYLLTYIFMLIAFK